MARLNQFLIVIISVIAIVQAQEGFGSERASSAPPVVTTEDLTNSVNNISLSISTQVPEPTGFVDTSSSSNNNSSPTTTTTTTTTPLSTTANSLEATDDTFEETNNSSDENRSDEVVPEPLEPLESSSTEVGNSSHAEPEPDDDLSAAENLGLSNETFFMEEVLDDKNETTSENVTEEQPLFVGDGTSQNINPTSNSSDVTSSEDDKTIGLQDQIYIVAGTLGGIILLLIILVLALSLSVSSMKKQLQKPQTRYLSTAPDQPQTTSPTTAQEPLHAYDNNAFTGAQEMQERPRDSKLDLDLMGYSVYNGQQNQKRYSTNSHVMRVEDSVAPYSNDNRRSGSGYNY